MIKFLTLLATSFLGVGYFKYAPGTAGALAGWVFFEIVNPDKFAFVSSLVLIFVSIFVIAWAQKYYPVSSKKEDRDPPSVVLDEVVAVWLVFSLLIVQTFAVKIFAFALFRFFDVVKPLGIKQVEKINSFSLAIVLDDILAALYTVVLTNLLLYVSGKFFHLL